MYVCMNGCPQYQMHMTRLFDGIIRGVANALGGRGWRWPLWQPSGDLHKR